MATTRIQYIGVHDEVDVPLLRRTVKRNATVEVDTEHARILLDQEANWRSAAARQQGGKRPPRQSRKERAAAEQAAPETADDTTEAAAAASEDGQ